MDTAVVVGGMMIVVALIFSVAVIVGATAHRNVTDTIIRNMPDQSNTWMTVNYPPGTSEQLKDCLQKLPDGMSPFDVISRLPVDKHGKIILFGDTVSVGDENPFVVDKIRRLRHSHALEMDECMLADKLGNEVFNRDVVRVPQL